MELPVAFEARMKELLKTEYDAFYTALCTENAVKGLRVNTHKVATDVFCKHAPFSLTPIPYAKNGFIVSDDAQAGKHPYHHAGAYYMQDPGAMATVAAIPATLWARNRLKVLDLCAAPGGKTTQLAALCERGGGAVLANEYNAARSRILAGNVERMGLSNVLVTNTDSQHIAAWYPSFFDLVLVDAPCSGEGMYRKSDQAVLEWSPENVSACAVRQREILANAAQCVAEEGYLLYSTCTYSTEENEKVVANFLEAHPAFRLCSCRAEVVACTADGIDVTGGKHPELALCRRFYPHRSPGEGQFIALLQRSGNDGRGGATVKDAFGTLAKNELAVVNSFLRETLGHTPLGLGRLGGNVVSFPAHETLGLPVPPFGTVAAGVTVGEVRKDRIVPHHHFFTAYGGDFSAKLCLDADADTVMRYLAGEELPVPAELGGFCAVLLAIGDTAITLGGGKAVG